MDEREREKERSFSSKVSKNERLTREERAN